MILIPDVTSHKLLHWSNVDRNGFRDTFTFFHWCRYITLGNCNRNFFITSKLDMKTQHFNISAVFRCFYQSKFGVNTWFPAGPSWRLTVRPGRVWPSLLQVIKSMSEELWLSWVCSLCTFIPLYFSIFSGDNHQLLFINDSMMKESFIKVIGWLIMMQRIYFSL